ncbi:hypothetical protein L249_7141 [Ophiocordyceps polyrhachis-furcata BCC 54312]|uniref:ATP-dependent RNA helicase n=1 Tax=Ophiocordyceps polyrhachis-furcata BCC 54312 TaxID=1330021 RepID=A0A367LBH4_9HYPO|nr:hypothetical protein L249_7141 [Ophiocordyceps polyrhachis-furcata BCC 54312]
MYARYVPPPKAVDSSLVSSRAPTDGSSKKLTNGSPKAPADGYSYARYVPSTPLASKTISSSKTTKRKRESEDALSLQASEKKPRTCTIENGSPVAEDEPSEVVNTEKKKKKNRRKRKQRTRLDDGDDSQDSGFQDSKDDLKTVDGVNDALDPKVESAADLTAPAQEAETVPRSEEKDEEGEKKMRKKEKEKKKKKKHVEFVNGLVEEEKEDTRHRAVLERKAKSLVLASKAPPDPAPASEGEAVTEQHGLQPLPQPAVVADDDETKPTYDSLPAWLAKPIRVPQDSRKSFEALGIAPKTARALGHKGFTEAFAIQTAAIPLLLPSSRDEPGDVLISAATGSGKTMAYALPIVRDVGQGVMTRLRALVVLPTRELVKQAQEVFEICARAYDGEDRKKVRVGVAVGSQSMQAEQEMLMASESRYDPDVLDELREKKPRAEEEEEEEEDDDDDDGRRQLGGWEGEVMEWSSKVDVLICTPGRLVEHMEQTAGFSLDYVRWLVVDEADKLMAQSFQGWLDRVLDRFRRTNGIYGARDFPDMAYSGVRKVMVSATLKRDPGLVHRLALRKPRLLLLEGKDDKEDDETASAAEHTLPAELREFAVRVHETSLKPLYLLDLVRGGQMEASLGAEGEPDEGTTRSERPLPPPPPPPCLVFTKSNESALRLARLLELLDPSLSPHVQSLTSTTATQTRRKTLRALNSPSSSSTGVRVVVASDLVARGIDIPRLGHVINYDLPASVAGYVHRVGRTARAGRRGCAWTLLPDPDSGWFWGRIVKDRAIGRMHEVERTRIGEMGEEKTRRYEEALAELGREAVEVRRGG